LKRWKVVVPLCGLHKSTVETRGLTRWMISSGPNTSRHLIVGFSLISWLA
jgi:hypothetical protein